MEWNAAAVYALRRALRLTQEGLAEYLGVSPKSARNWEHGKHRPAPVHEQALDTALGRLSPEQRDSFDQYLADPTLGHGPFPSVLRPSPTSVQPGVPISGGVLPAELSAVSPDNFRHLIAAVDDARRYLDGDVVSHLRSQLASYAEDDGAYGPRTILPAVLGIVGVVETYARQVKPSIRRQLLVVGAQGAEFAGWLYRDIGLPVLADYWRDRAVEWAQEAGDLVMQAYVLLRKSQAAWDERDALRMLTLAQAVQEGPWELPPAIRAEAAQQEARGHAMLTGDRNQVERKLNHTHRFLTDARQSQHDNEHPPAVHYNASLCNYSGCG